MDVSNYTDTDDELTANTLNLRDRALVADVPDALFKHTLPKDTVESLLERLDASISGASLLMQRGVGEWDATRCVGPAISAWTYRDGDRLELVYHEAGETDEDGYTWQTDAYEVQFRGADGEMLTVECHGEDAEDVRMQAALTVVYIMQAWAAIKQTAPV